MLHSLLRCTHIPWARRLSLEVKLPNTTQVMLVDTVEFHSNLMFAQLITTIKKVCAVNSVIGCVENQLQACINNPRVVNNGDLYIKYTPSNSLVKYEQRVK